MSAELKPCPFCGGQPSRDEFEGVTYCSQCDAHPGHGHAWNTRPGEQAARLAILREVRAVLLSFPTLRLLDSGSFIDAERACAGIDRLEAAERAKAT